MNNASNRTPNRLMDETSPYLLQHAYNPVDWYPWGQEAFAKAKEEDKPIFLSIGYSTCHWCHVMAHESFENAAVSKLLNDHFISIKVDKEERPDVDTIYMRVCQAYTGNGGWPTSIFMSPDQKPFYAGTYFPPSSFMQLLQNIDYNWQHNRQSLMQNSESIIEYVSANPQRGTPDDENLAESAFLAFEHTFDEQFGGFGNAPKFPSPHNLLFLLEYAKQEGNQEALEMVEKTLTSMYQGGIFDHVGYGFSRYSTDRYWLVPHFEKMLYDNALLAVVYLTAFEQTGNQLYRAIAEKIFVYVNREMTNETGGCYSAQDADSDGVEGKYYVFTPDEVIHVLGKTDGERFNQQYDISPQGNFEGKSIPNLIRQTPPFQTMDELHEKLYEYRKGRTTLHRDDKILTAWNSLMIWAYATAYRILGDEQYATAMRNSISYIEKNLTQGDTIFVSATDGKHSGKGYLDDYAFYMLALVSAYEATFDEQYLRRALQLNQKLIADFWDAQNGGFYFYGSDSEQLIIRPKESYDGAIPSGNSAMAYNLDRLAKLTKDDALYAMSEQQRSFMQLQAGEYPAGFSFFLLSTFPTREVVCVLKDKKDLLAFKHQSNDVVKVLESPTKAYPYVNEKTTFYVCEGNRCLAPVNELR